MDNQKSHLHSLSSIANILIILTGIIGTSLMLAGFSFRIGYFSSFGLTIGAIPLEFGESIGEAFYMGLLLIIEIFTRVWWPFIAVFSFIAIVFILALLILLGNKIGLNQKINKWLTTFDKPTQKRSLLIRLSLVLLEEFQQYGLKAFLIFSAVTLYPYLVTLKPYQLGTNQGEEQIQKFSELNHDCSRLPEIGLNCARIVQINSGNVVAEGAIITGNSANHLVLYDGESIQLFNKSADYSITIGTTLTIDTEVYLGSE